MFSINARRKLGVHFIVKKAMNGENDFDHGDSFGSIHVNGHSMVEGRNTTQISAVIPPISPTARPSIAEPHFIQTQVSLGRKGSGTFGDIMSGSPYENMVSSDDNAPTIHRNQILWTDAPAPTLHDGLVTSTGASLQEIFTNSSLNISALDRIALTANGNLQRSKFL